MASDKAILHNATMLNRTSYTALAYLLAPLAVARLFFLARKNPGYSKHLVERFGRTGNKKFGKKTLWLHAVSVGEVIASETLVNALLEKYTDLSICISNMTPTGKEQVKRSFGHWEGRVNQVYAPYDLPGSINSFLDQIQPIGLVVMETELWPNWLELVKKRGIPGILVNGRMSEKSQTGYQKLAGLTSSMLSNLSAISAQTDIDASRFKSLGAENVQVTGSMKSDFELGDAERDKKDKLQNIFALTNPSKVLIAASTHAGEDELIIEAFKSLWQQDDSLRLILVPRHPERAEAIRRLLTAAEIGFRLRSEVLPLDAAHPVALCDLIGELRGLYGLASIAFIGGTLVDHGGHNPLEPAAWGAAMIAGFSQRNFDQIFNSLESAGALLRISDSAEALKLAFTALLENADQRAEMGIAAEEYLQANRGATERNLRLLENLIPALDAKSA